MNTTLTKEQVAKLLQVSPRTVDALRQKGLPYFNVGRSVRFDAKDIEAWLRNKSNTDAMSVTTKEQGGNQVSMN